MGQLQSQRRPPSGGDPLEGTPYRVLGTLGRGGMGEVFDAEHRALGKRVAVKLFHPELASPELFERFRLEAQVLARLQDERLVVVNDLGQTPGGVPYFVMERLVGRTLREELTEGGPFEPEAAVALLEVVLGGLTTLHEAGVVHRDLKPGNIFLCDAVDGKQAVKLLDLGIAKVLAPASERLGVKLPPAGLTQGMALGTPQYMAPEQARGETVDARADVYAAALVFYKMVTGKTPFERCNTLAALMVAQDRPVLPPSRVAPRPIPPAVDGVVLRALAVDPDDRFDSAIAFGVALREALDADDTDTGVGAGAGFVAAGPDALRGATTAKTGLEPEEREATEQTKRAPATEPEADSEPPPSEPPRDPLPIRILFPFSMAAVVATFATAFVLYALGAWGQGRP